METDTITSINGRDFAEWEATCKAYANEQIGNGWDNRADFERMRETRARHDLEANLRRVIPERYIEAAADEHLKKKFDAALQERKGMIFTGPVGRGKTHQVCGLLRRYIETDSKPTSVAFRSVPRLLDALRPGGDAGPELLSRLQGVRLLALDDLGAQKDSEWTQEQLFLLIDARYQTKRPTLITTNVKPRDFIKVFGQRLAGRLIESSTIESIGGHDRRLPEGTAA